MDSYVSRRGDAINAFDKRYKELMERFPLSAASNPGVSESIRISALDAALAAYDGQRMCDECDGMGWNGSIHRLCTACNGTGRVSRQ
jgi:hypothetical protein